MGYLTSFVPPGTSEYCCAYYLRILDFFAHPAEFPRVSQITLNRRGERVRAPEYAPHDPLRLLERIHGLAEIVERGS